MKTNEDKSRACAFSAGLLSVLAFALYNWNNFTGTSNPNVSSWMVWASITILNFTSYKKLTGDWVKSILPTTNSVLCVLTASFALYKGSFGRLTPVDLICLGLGMIAGLGWWIYKSASYAQIVLQIAIVIGFIPTIIGALNDPIREPTISWFLWLAAFTAQYFAVKYTWGGKRIEFLYPVNMVVFHGVVFILTVLPH